MARLSAGLLVYRIRDGITQVFLVHPGGPFWARKDDGAWSIPKGEFETAEAPLEAAIREMREETGVAVAGPFAPLGEVRQAGGKIIHAFAAQADFDATAIVSNRFEIEWPPRSGRMASFPEVDRGEWFTLPAAEKKLNAAQVELLKRLGTVVSSTSGSV